MLFKDTLLRTLNDYSLEVLCLCNVALVVINILRGVKIKGL